MTGAGRDVTATGSADDSVPALRSAVFGDRLELAERFVGRLATDGVTRGLIGPREVGRLWDRHLLNSAVLTELIPMAARVVDVGSGAGLPGVPMAIRRADLQVDLVEPMLRRTDFLDEVVTELGLARSVRVIRGRAEDPTVKRLVGNSDWVVARAVAPLDRLVKWCLPLVVPGGRLLALKGAKAAAEAAEHREAVRRLGGAEIEVQELGAQCLAAPTWVVVIRRADAGRSIVSKRGRA